VRKKNVHAYIFFSSPSLLICCFLLFVYVYIRIDVYTYEEKKVIKKKYINICRRWVWERKRK